MVKILPILLLSSLAFAGTLNWGTEFIVNWTISGSSVTFTVTVSGDTATNADWWSVGVSDTSSSGMTNMDTFMI
jgi:hypothetical protein